MDTIESDILKRLAKKGRGRIFFAQEFMTSGRRALCVIH